MAISAIFAEIGHYATFQCVSHASNHFIQDPHWMPIPLYSLTRLPKLWQLLLHKIVEKELVNK